MQECMNLLEKYNLQSGGRGFFCNFPKNITQFNLNNPVAFWIVIVFRPSLNIGTVFCPSMLLRKCIINSPPPPSPIQANSGEDERHAQRKTIYVWCRHCVCPEIADLERIFMIFTQSIHRTGGQLNNVLKVTMQQMRALFPENSIDSAKDSRNWQICSPRSSSLLSWRVNTSDHSIQ